MRYYCITDIHGCLKPLEKALALVLPHLNEPETRLIFMGDYIHGGADNYQVLDKIIGLQIKYHGKVIALMGNHEETVAEGWTNIDYYYSDDDHDSSYAKWMSSLPRFHADGRTIFVHAGIDEQAGELWKAGTAEHIFTEKYPAQTGLFFEDYKIIAGHIGTCDISGDPDFHGIYYDGQSHFYLDSTVVKSGFLNVLLADTAGGKYYEVTESGTSEIMPYGEK